MYRDNTRVILSKIDLTALESCQIYMQAVEGQEEMSFAALAFLNIISSNSKQVKHSNRWVEKHFHLHDA